MGNPKAEPTGGKPSGLSTGEVSAPHRARRAHSDSPMTVSTDGSALGNPNGPMGWGWVDHYGSGCDAGGASNGTNQIGELCAVLQALRAHPSDVSLVIESDSKYAIQCSTVWLKGWKRNGWKNSKKQPVKNVEIIKAIDREIASREAPVKFVWVKGHAGNEFNEKVDILAHGYATAVGNGRKSGYLPIEGWQSLLASPYASGVSVPADVRAQLSASSHARNETSFLSDRSSAARPQSLVQTHEKPKEPAQDVLDFALPEEQTSRSRLAVSGAIRITPPPSSSSTHPDHVMHVTGTVSIDVAVDSGGNAILRNAPLQIDRVERLSNNN
ncbi:ribonuclease H family protein [Bifidobacterium aquikefiri]|uniref:ribonuclease H family protein n=1 Tax=Bifidobacterium aquikefiri TaxID=1653207 RepID=UPI0039E788A5